MSEHEVVKRADGSELRLSVLRAQESHKLVARKRHALKNLTPEKKLAFYYNVYKLIDKHGMEDKKEPIFQMGLSEYTFMREPLLIGGFQTTYGELFSRMHQAINETELTHGVE